LKIPPSPYSKGPLKETIIQINLVGMSIIFHCIKPRLPKWNGSWVVSIQENVNFNCPPRSYLVFHKSGLSKNCSSSVALSEYISRSYVDCCKFCINIWSSDIHQTGVVKPIALKIMALRSSSMAWPSYQI
jgi:hypothetical protein